MTVIVTEAVSDRLRGRLSVWFIELRAGCFVGNISKRHRDRVWRLMVDEIAARGGNAVMAWGSSRNEVGFEFDTIGENRRVQRRLDGVSLIVFEKQPPKEEQEP